jgi:hypothetical protein
MCLVKKTHRILGRKKHSEKKDGCFSCGNSRKETRQESLVRMILGKEE